MLRVILTAVAGAALFVVCGAPGIINGQGHRAPVQPHAQAQRVAPPRTVRPDPWVVNNGVKPGPTMQTQRIAPPMIHPDPWVVNN
jgi:hypothetical protein